MNDLKKKLKRLEKSRIKNDWETINSREGLSTREKLEKLVSRNIRTEEKEDQTLPKTEKGTSLPDFTVRDFNYSSDEIFGKVCLGDWMKMNGNALALLFNDPSLKNIDPLKLLYFDTETTGLSGGTGTIPFMLGFGFFDEGLFRVKIFVLNNLDEERKFLEEVDNFLKQHDFSATITYNGKSFDFPLMETRYILNRRRFPLLKIPHLDFLPPARIIWKNTYESRRLGFLGDILLGISRDDDVDGSMIPSLYFSYLRSGNFSLLENVIEHNALDIVGLSALLLLALKYIENIASTDDEGEMLGIGQLYERSGELKEAERIYGLLNSPGVKEEVLIKSVKKLAFIKKKNHFIKEAGELWKILSESGDHQVIKELSIHYEHRERDFYQALEIVRKGLEIVALSDKQREGLKKRLDRLKKKIEKLKSE